MRFQLYIKFNDGSAMCCECAKIELTQTNLILDALDENWSEIKEVLIKPISGSTQETDDVAASTPS